MEISKNGINLIKKWEGVRLEAYQDIIGVWTIGYGHINGVKAGMKITEKEAEGFLKQDIKSHVGHMEQLIKVPLNQNQFDALASFHFNLGPKILEGTTLLTFINEKKWKEAAEQMKLYMNAGGEPSQGLINRRNDEAALFLKAVEVKEEPKKEEPKKEEVPPPDSSEKEEASSSSQEKIVESVENTKSSESAAKKDEAGSGGEAADKPINVIKKAYEKFFS